MTACSIYPYGEAKTFIASATLLWPTTAWTKIYVAVSGWPLSRDHHDNPIGAPTLQIVANADDAEVRIRRTTDVCDGVGVAGGAAGKIVTWKVAAARSCRS